MESTWNFQNWGRHAIGIFYVCLVVILWVSSSELTQSIFQNKSFNQPFFLTYFSTALFIIYCPFFIRLFINEWTKYWNGNNAIDQSLYTHLSPHNSPSHSYSSLSPDDPNQQKIECVEYNSGDDEPNDNDGQNEIDESVQNIAKPHSRFDAICIPSIDQTNKLSLIQTFKLSLLFCPIWFSMNWTFNISLNLTSVASNTILSTMSGPFSLLLSRCLLNTKLSFCNLSGVLITLLGAVFIGYLDDKESSGNNNTVWGDMLALISAFIYGVYVTLIKYKIEDESSVNMFLFFGCLGLINVLTLWPFLFILDVLKFESFVWPSNDVLGLLTLNGVISVGSDYFWAQSILYTSPVVATVGLSLMMPVAMIADEVFRGERHSFMYWSGSLFVMVGFILVNLDFKQQNQEKCDDKEQLHLQNS